jgi:flavorubredoxin
VLDESPWDKAARGLAQRTSGKMASTTEIASDVYRISIFVPEINLEFSHFLVRDDEPLLFHAGLRNMFPILQEEISRLIDISKLRHIAFSHFESDECGALNRWLERAPAAEPGEISATVREVG